MKISNIYKSLINLSMHQLACIISGISPAAFDRINSGFAAEDEPFKDAYFAASELIKQAVAQNEVAGNAVFISGKVCPHSTMLNQKSVIAWMDRAGVDCGYFDVQAGNAQSIRLRAANSAARAIASGKIGAVSVKAIKNWLELHGKDLGLINAAGTISAKTLESIAYVVYTTESPDD